MSGRRFAITLIVCVAVASLESLPAASRPSGGVSIGMWTLLVLGTLLASALLLIISRKTSASLWAIHAATIALACWVPLLTNDSPGQAYVFTANRALILSLPVFVLGLIGVQTHPQLRIAGITSAVWLTIASCGLIALMFGAHLDIRLLLFPFWWYVPAGLSHIKNSLRGRRGFEQCLAACTAITLGVLAMGMLKLTLNGPLTAIYLMGG